MHKWEVILKSLSYVTSTINSEINTIITVDAKNKANRPIKYIL